MWFSILFVALNAWLVTRVAVRYRGYDIMLHRIEFKFPSICTSDCLNFCTVLLIAEAKPSFDRGKRLPAMGLVGVGVEDSQSGLGPASTPNGLNPIGSLRQLWS